jgi:hypothetical protein
VRRRERQRRLDLQVPLGIPHVEQLFKKLG